MQLVIGFTRQPAALYLTVMHSGIALAPIVGRLAAAEILDGFEAAPLAPYRPARFEGGKGRGRDPPDDRAIQRPEPSHPDRGFIAHSQ